MSTDDWDTDAGRLRVGPWVGTSAGSSRDRRADGGRRRGGRDATGTQPPDASHPPSASDATGVDDDLPGGGAERDGGAEDSGDYLGRRRERTSTKRRWVALWAIVAAAGLAVAAPVALRLSARQSPAGATTNAVTHGPPVMAGPDSAAPDTRLSQGASESPSPSASPSSSRYQPVNYEAEAAANILSGAASVSSYPGASGGKIVENLGSWGPGSRKHGSLAFPNVAVPVSGVYVLTLYLVKSGDPEDSGDPAARNAVITVSGGGGVTVTVTGGRACCATTTVEVTLKRGVNTITFNSPDGRAPSLDKIVVSMP